jgi:hypothetical protein
MFMVRCNFTITMDPYGRELDSNVRHVGRAVWIAGTSAAIGVDAKRE